MEPIPEESCSQVDVEGDDDDARHKIVRGAAHCYERRCARCTAMGSVQIVTVRAGDRELELHKCALVSRSAYLTRVFRSSSRFSLPPDFPGGPPAFDLVVRFCLGFGVSFDPSNVAVLRCAAEYLEMNREVAASNLSERAELYLCHVALREWGGAIQVIKSVCSSESLILLAEDAQIIARCVDAIASMACVEFRTNPRVRVLEPHSGARQIVRDLVRLPFPILSRIIVSCRRRGVTEESVCHVLVKYVERWLFAERIAEEDASDEDENSQLSEEQMVELLECIVRLLPFERGAVAVSFLFALLRYSIAVGAGPECCLQLEARISSQLDSAGVSDLLMPFKTALEVPLLMAELDSMKRIVSMFMRQHGRDRDSSPAVDFENVSRVWDEYLAEIAYSPSVSPLMFTELIEAVPAFVRVSHDELYRAILIFLKAHPSACQQERSMICKSLDCQKLSQDACIHLVQNEMMPLRTIVQAMFAQQVHTRSVMNHSFRLSSVTNPSSQGRKKKDCEELPLMGSSCIHKADLEATNSKLVSLEQQLLSIQRTLHGTESSSSSAGMTATTTTTTSASSSSSKSRHQHKENGGVARKITSIFHKMGLCKHHLTPSTKATTANAAASGLKNGVPADEDEHHLLEPARTSVDRRPVHQRYHSMRFGS